MPFTQMHPFGCAGSGVTFVKTPLLTVASTPQRDTHIAQ